MAESTKLDPGITKRKTSTGLELRALKNRRELRVENRDLRETSGVDGVTGLLNRRAFDDKAKTYIAQIGRRFERGQFIERFGIAFLDIDNFKPFNDKFGHSVGDGVLGLVAEAWKASLREADILGRYGGDEMVAVLTNVDDYHLSVVVADSIQSRVEKHIREKMPEELKKILKGSEVNVTVGLAYSDCIRPATLEEIMKIADQNMLARKKRKENNV